MSSWLPIAALGALIIAWLALPTMSRRVAVAIGIAALLVVGLMFFVSPSRIRY
jgi:hypothetical protein